jgi:hypothetical protein
MDEAARSKVMMRVVWWMKLRGARSWWGWYDGWNCEEQGHDEGGMIGEAARSKVMMREIW